MNSSLRIDVESLAAFDVHVHMEATDDGTATDAAVKKYFGESGAPREANALAEYYRSRKIAFVIFTVDERLTGKPRVSNDEVIRFAERNLRHCHPLCEYRIRIEERKAARKPSGWCPKGRSVD